MSIIEFFKYCFQMKKDASKILEEVEQKKQQYLLMTTEELDALPRGALFDAVQARLDKKIESFENLAEGFDTLSESQKIFYCLSTLQSVVFDGGLCQFFTTKTYFLAPYVSGYLETIGAHEHKDLYDGFIEKYNIELDHLFLYQIRKPKDLEKRARLFPFHKYDDVFFTLQPLLIPLAQFAKDHLEEF